MIISLKRVKPKVDMKFAIWMKRNHPEVVRKWRAPARQIVEWVKPKSETKIDYKQKYEKYLSGNHWRKVRERFFRKVHNGKGRCFICGTFDGRLDVHHLTYERIGREKLNDLRCLCEKCHKIVHEKYPDNFGESTVNELRKRHHEEAGLFYTSRI
jgi:5-methylcytosine-specific restriction endonuclease McrA